MKNIPSVPLRYDTAEINKAVPIEDVVRRYAGIDTSKSGRGNIKCPSPKHTDKKPSAHIYSHTNTCTCFSCGTTFTPITIVMDNMSVSLPNACKMLIEDYNLDMEYYSNISEVRKAKADISQGKTTDIFPLTPQECKMIGLESAMSTTVLNPLYDTKDSEDSYSYGDKYIRIENLSETWKKDRNTVEAMLIEKCDETLENIRQRMVASTQAISAFIADFAESKYKEAVKVYEAYEKYNTPERPLKLTEEQFDMVCAITIIKQEQELLLQCINEKNGIEEMRERIIAHRKERVAEKSKQAQEKWGR